MKIKIFLVLYTLFYLNTHSQNLVKNPGFEILSLPLIEYTCSLTYTHCEPFNLLEVPNWYSFVRTSQIKSKTLYPQITGDAAAFSKTWGNYGIIDWQEGIYQDDIKFKKGKSYYIEFNYLIQNIYNHHSSIKIIAANGLNNTDGTINNSNTNIEIIGLTPYNSPINSWLKYSILYTPTSDFNQVALFSTYDLSILSYVSSEIIFDDIIITENCCASKIDFSNITNPPSVNVQDYIKCNSNVTFNNNSFTDFRAKNEVLLANNTTISGVESFMASAEDCMAKPVEFYPNIEQAKCKFKVFLSACYGSGQYEFYFGEMLSETGNKDYAKENAGSSIVVKVKDIVTGTIISKTITFPSPIVYTGNFTLKIPNTFTPNGDGYNDNFRITDNGKTRYAYNATRYKLQIWNRWGDDVLLREKSITDDDINGFNDQEIYWNGRNNGSNDNENTPPIVSDGTYYYLFSVNNCDNNEKIVRGSITLIDGSSFIENTSLEKNVNETVYSRKTEISPNPTNNILNVKLFSTKTKTNILITDMLGKQINTNFNLTADKDGLQEYNIDCSGMANGIYFCTVTKGNTLETFKFSVIK